MSNAQTPLLQTMREEETGYQLMLDLLQLEQKALMVYQTHSLEALAAQKIALLEHLSELGTVRAQLLREFNVHDRTGFLCWLADKTECRELWQSVELKAAKSRAVNTINGQLIHERLSVTGNTLKRLMQQPQLSVMYGPDGETRGGSSQSGGRIIGAA